MNKCRSCLSFTASKVDYFLCLLLAQTILMICSFFLLAALFSFGFLQNEQLNASFNCSYNRLILALSLLWWSLLCCKWYDNDDSLLRFFTGDFNLVFSQVSFIQIKMTITIVFFFFSRTLNFHTDHIPIMPFDFLFTLQAFQIACMYALHRSILLQNQIKQ